MTTSLPCRTHVWNHKLTSCRWKCRSTSFMNIPRIPRAGRCQRFNLLSKIRQCTASMVRCVARGSNEGMKKQTRWVTSSKKIADVLRGDGRWKRDRRHVYMTGKSETECEYPASLVVAKLSAINRQMNSDGAIRVGELHFAGAVPDEGGLPHRV